MKSIMLIDDDPTMLKLLSTLIEMEGLRPVPWNGEPDITAEAIRQQPDLILLDVNLRGINGINVLKELRATSGFEKTPILMTSGMDYSETCMQEGATAFFLKPYMPDTLLQTIRVHINNKA